MGLSWKRELIQFPSVDYLRYNRFKYNVKRDNVIEKTSNSDYYYYFASIINVCSYLAETYEDDLYLLLVVLG